VEEPKPSFALQRPELEISYSDEQKAVFLNWQRQAERVRYEIFRSPDGQSWHRIGYAYPSSTGYQDVSIGGLNQWLDQIFHKETTKTYFYKVIAIDTKEPDAQKSTLPSNVASVEVKLDKGDEHEDET
jgi:penicillin-binding protein 2A